MKHLRLQNWGRRRASALAPHRPTPSPAGFTPLGGDPRLYTGDWWQVYEEQAQHAAERAAREG